MPRMARWTQAGRRAIVGTMHRTRHAISSLALAMVAAISLVIVTPPAPASAAGYRQTASTTYALNPDKGRLDVTVTLKVTNTKQDTISTYSCVKYRYDYWFGYVPYTTTCTTTTSWYMNETSAWVENEAMNLRATSGGSSLKVSTGMRGTYYRIASIAFPKLYYGSSRTITLKYSVVGGQPRSDSFTRTLRAYASFCAVANGEDQGQVTVTIPKTYTVETSGDPMQGTSDSKTRTYKSGTIADTSNWYACFDGVNESGYRTERITASGGKQIELRSWPEDAEWTAGVKKEIDEGLPALEELIGSPLATSGTLIVKEASTGNEYAGFYDKDTNTVTVGEDFRQPSLVQHELAHTWFNQAAFSDVWLDEGFAEWAGRTASGDEVPCTEPESGAESISLATWKYLQPRSTDGERQAVADQYEAACDVITQVATAAGQEGMTAAIAALLARRDPYAADPAVKRPSSVGTWKDWLDAVDELALRPAGANEDLATDLLLKYGVTTDRALLGKRTAARRAYHELIDTVKGWVVPPVVRTPLTAWNFDAARDALDASGQTWELTGQTDQALADVDARHGPAAQAWQAALTVDDLRQAADLAQRQLNAARDLASTMEVARAPRDVLQQVGLIGTTVPSTDPILAAVKAGDIEQAAALNLQLRSLLLSSRDEGVRRLAISIGILLALLVAVLILGALRGRGGREPKAARVLLPHEITETVVVVSPPPQIAGSGEAGAKEPVTYAPSRPTPTYIVDDMGRPAWRSAPAEAPTPGEPPMPAPSAAPAPTAAPAPAPTAAPAPAPSPAQTPPDDSPTIPLPPPPPPPPSWNGGR